MKKWAVYILIVYIALAFTWWTVLLLKRNSELELAKIELNKEPIAVIKAASQKQKWMIVSEGAVLALSLLIGVVFIFRSYKKEILLTKKQNNFLLSVSHELKSPLTSIKLSLDTIKKRKPEQNVMLELNNIALSEAGRLEKLIEELLMTVRLESGYVYQFERTDVVEMIKDVIRNLTQLKQDVQLDFISNEERSYLMADKILFRSLIINLIENALKYGNCLPVKVEVEESKQYLKIAVLDNGVGISEREKKIIFEKFYRIGNEETRTSKGVGLGLYVVSMIAEIHNGTISVADNVPNGSIFTLKFIKN